MKIRWHLFQHNLILRPRSNVTEDEEEEEEILSDKMKWLRPFSDVAGYSGLFICGPCPHWIIMTGRGQLRLHPMPIDNRIVSFAQFHNVNCPKGFLYFNKKDELRISVLPPHLSYDAYWPVRKVALKATPQHIAFHMDMKVTDKFF